MTFQDFHGKGKAVKGEVGKRMVGYLSAALGLVVGLAWNDAVKSAIDFFIPNSNGTIVAKFIYAAIITILIVLALLGLEKWVGRKQDYINLLRFSSFRTSNHNFSNRYIQFLLLEKVSGTFSLPPFGLYLLSALHVLARC